MWTGRETLRCRLRFMIAFGSAYDKRPNGKASEIRSRVYQVSVTFPARVIWAHGWAWTVWCSILSYGEITITVIEIKAKMKGIWKTVPSNLTERFFSYGEITLTRLRQLWHEQRVSRYWKRLSRIAATSSATSRTAPCLTWRGKLDGLSRMWSNCRTDAACSWNALNCFGGRARRKR